MVNATLSLGFVVCLLFRSSGLEDVAVEQLYFNQKYLICGLESGGSVSLLKSDSYR